MVIQHAFLQNLPPYCIDPSDGKSYLSKRMELKAAALLSLVDSIDLCRIDFTGSWKQSEDHPAGDNVKLESDGIQIEHEYEDELDLVDYEVDTMVTFLNTIVRYFFFDLPHLVNILNHSSSLLIYHLGLYCSFVF